MSADRQRLILFTASYVRLLAISSLVMSAAASCGSSWQPSSALSPKTSGSPNHSIGSFDDRYDFRSFAEQLSAAIEGADLQFFMNHVIFKSIDCGAPGIPPPPDSCQGQTAGTAIKGTYVGVWNTDPFSLDAAEYEQFIRQFLTEPSGATPDEYGDAGPRLHAYAVFRQEVQGRDPSPLPGTRTVEAIATRVVPGTILRSKYLPPGRAILLFEVIFDGEQWVIVGQSIPTAATAALLDPSSAAGVAEGSERIL